MNDRSHAAFAASPFVAPQSFDDPQAALARVSAIYRAAVDHLHAGLERVLAQAGDEAGATARIRACYPFVRVRVADPPLPHDAPERSLAYGFVHGPGLYETTLTRPDLFADYLLEQFRLLLHNHARVQIEVGSSSQPIPLHFSFTGDENWEGRLGPGLRARLAAMFDLPNLAAMDDRIANGTFEPRHGQPLPLALFNAPRIDYSLQRLRHYTGTAPEHFQNYVLLTNYGFYVDAFVRHAQALLAEPGRGYEALVEPGNLITRHDGRALVTEGQAPPRQPQMPAYHLVRRGHAGITLVNIGVGPSNAKTITDHIAVLRPHVWLMLGHCAGLRNTQRLGDYVLAHAYVREDHVLDEDLPPWVPIPALAEVQQALEAAVAEVTGLAGAALKQVMRTGTVASTADRNWELAPFHDGDGNPARRFSQSRAIALDMESATVAANGFRLRVPYGTLLCVSDKPLHGEIKLPGMADHFYRERVGQHLAIGLRALERLREAGSEQLHSRKLRSFAEVAFQ